MTESLYIVWRKITLMGFQSLNADWQMMFSSTCSQKGACFARALSGAFINAQKGMEKLLKYPHLYRKRRKESLFLKIRFNFRPPFNFKHSL